MTDLKVLDVLKAPGRLRAVHAQCNIVRTTFCTTGTSGCFSPNPPTAVSATIHVDSRDLWRLIIGALLRRALDEHDCVHSPRVRCADSCAKYARKHMRQSSQHDPTSTFDNGKSHTVHRLLPSGHVITERAAPAGTRARRMCLRRE